MDGGPARDETHHCGGPVQGGTKRDGEWAAAPAGGSAAIDAGSGSSHDGGGRAVKDARHESEAAAAAGMGRGRRSPARLVIAALILVFAGLFLYRLLDEIGPREVLAAALEADPALLLLTLAAVIGRFAVWSLKWAAITRRAFPGVPVVRFPPILMSAAITNLVTPTARTAGGFLRTYLLSTRDRLPVLRVHGTVLQDQVTNMVGLWLVSFAAMAALPFWYNGSASSGENRLTPGAEAAVSGIGIAGVAILLTVVLGRERLGRLLSRPDYTRPLTLLYPLARWIPRVRKKYPDGPAFAAGVPTRAGDVFGPLFRVDRDHRHALRDISLGAAVWFCLCMANYLAFLACGADPGEVSLPLVVAILSTGNVIGVISMIPGGIGAMEASMIGLHILVGVRPELAAAANLIFRIAFYLFVLGFGGLSLAWTSRQRRRSRHVQV